MPPCHGVVRDRRARWPASEQGPRRRDKRRVARGDHPRASSSKLFQYRRSGLASEGIKGVVSTTLTNCNVSGNSNLFRGNGGGLHNAVRYGGVSTLTLTNCTVKGNSAVAGGGIYNQGTQSVSSSAIIKNQANGSDGIGIGGGLYVATGGVVTLKKTTFALNFASTSNNSIAGTVT